MNVFAPSPKRSPVEDHNYGNPVSGHQIYLKMASNFPPDAIQWVKRATWEGPVDISWENIDTSSIKSWAASRQPERVQEFEQKIKAHDGNVEPSILIKDNDTPKSIIIDGHHRAIARHNLNMPVLSYVGRINPEDRMAAEETHSKQVHSGADPQNKDVEGLLAKLEALWFQKAIGQPAKRKEIFKVLADLRDAGRSEFFLDAEARQFGWTLEQLDNPFLRAWLCGS